MAQRVPLEQTGVSVPVAVTNAAAPISNLDLTSMTQAFVISNYSSNLNSVWIGFDAGVTTLSGIEVPVGTAPLFTIDQIRQLYEIQNPSIKLFETLACGPYPDPDLIPVVCWNPSHIYAITNVAGPVNVGATFFKNVYV